MNSQILAFLGGEKTIKNPFKKYNPIGLEEVNAAKSVVESGVLSKFLGCWDKDFYGGEKVQKFERSIEKFFDVKHAVTVNSWTSGLICAVGAIGIEPGDEVIVSPWTMCASATAILNWNAIPVFADIEDQFFNLDIKSIEKNITPNTKAIMAIDIFGYSCNIDKIMELAKKYNLYVITDSAQSPGVIRGNKLTGTTSHIGGFSLNYHKHIHTGEGGIVITNDDYFYERLLLIRNHGEAVVGDKDVKNISNIIGYNFRLGEIESAIGIEQLKKLPGLIKNRQLIAKKLTFGLSNLEGIKLLPLDLHDQHAFYVYPIVLDIKKLQVSRELIVKALEAEGLEGIMNGYANIHLLPIYQKKIAYGNNGFPWSSDVCKREVDYKKGICPVAEKLHDETFMGLEMCLHELNNNEINLVVETFKKVWSNLDQLRKNA